MTPRPYTDRPAGASRRDPTPPSAACLPGALDCDPEFAVALLHDLRPVPAAELQQGQTIMVADLRDCSRILLAALQDEGSIAVSALADRRPVSRASLVRSRVVAPLADHSVDRQSMAEELGGLAARHEIQGDPAGHGRGDGAGRKDQRGRERRRGGRVDSATGIASAGNEVER